MRGALSDFTLLKHPGAWLPLLMSLSALLLFLSYLWLFTSPPVPGGGEGAPARFYQLLMTLQIPVILLFSVSRLPKEPRKVLPVLVLQLSAWLAAFLPVLLTEM